MPQFMLLLHEDPATSRTMSPDEMQRVIERYVQWSDGLAARGSLVRGEKLADDGGRHVRRRTGGGAPAVTDGPYTEGKEVVAGYFVVEAADYDGAVALAAGCPHLAGGWIEVRRVDVV
jgi:hypothetical protein